jgi:hypothetical protein
MAFTNSELSKIAVSFWDVYCGRTPVGMATTSGVDFDDGTKSMGVNSGQTGKADVVEYLTTGNCKVKIKLISTDKERVKTMYPAMQYTGGRLSGSSRAAKRMKENVWTFVANQTLANNTIFNEINMSTDSFQIPRGVTTNGFGFKATDKEHEYDLEIKGLANIDDAEYSSFQFHSATTPIVLPQPSAMFVDTVVKGVGYTVKPTSITCAGLTGATFDSQLQADGSLNIIILTAGTSVATPVGNFLPLVITGGTSTTPQTARVYIG